MFGKKYKKGAADTAAALRDFSEKQTEALEKIWNDLQAERYSLEEAKKRCEASADLATVCADAIAILGQRFLEHEYSIHIRDSIKNLERNERILLIGALHQLAMIIAPNDGQQNFVNSIHKYFGELECAETEDQSFFKIIGDKISDINSQKTIYQVIQEYLVIGDKLNCRQKRSIQELLKEFSIKEDDRKQIEEMAKNSCRILGAKGLSEKYKIYQAEQTEQDAQTSASTIAEESRQEKTNENVYETTNEPYAGISLELATRIVNTDVRTFSHISFSFYEKCLESKNYMIVNTSNGYKSNWVKVDKATNRLTDFISLNADSFQYSITRKDTSACDNGCDYVVDYNNDGVYVFYNKSLYYIDIVSDKYSKFDILIPFEWIECMQLYGDIIVLSNNESLMFYNIKDNRLEFVKDTSGNHIGGTVDCVTIIDNKIIFYSSHGEKIIGDDGGSLQNNICIYDIKTKSLKRVLDLGINGHFCLVALFGRYNSVYVIAAKNKDSKNTGLYELSLKEEEYILAQKCLIGSGEIKIYHNWVCVYYKYEYGANDNLDSIAAYNFTSNTYNIIAKECRQYDSEGILKKKWVRKSSDYKVIGQWLFYISEYLVWIIGQKTYPEMHIYRANLNISTQAVDLGEAKQV